MHVKTGDEVLIVAGKDKGKRSKVKQSLPKDGRVVVEGLGPIKVSTDKLRRFRHRM